MIQETFGSEVFCKGVCALNLGKEQGCASRRDAGSKVKQGWKTEKDRL